MRLPYKPAKIYKGGPVWYVYYSFIDPSTGKYVRQPLIKKGINRIKNLRDRLKEANRLVDSVNNLLKTGALNPYGADTVIPQAILQEMPLTAALQWAFDKKKKGYSPRTVSDANSALKKIAKSANKTHMNIPVEEVEMYHVRTILEDLAPGMSNTRYNVHLELLKRFFSVLAEWGIIKYNPAQHIKYLKREEATAHEPLTQEELRRVASHLKSKSPPMYLFSKIVFRTGIRPDEIRYIKAEHVTEQDIHLVPEMITSKKKKRLVPIDPDLKADIDKHGARRGEYLFSRKMEPGEKPIARNSFSVAWKALVKAPVSKGGLGVNKSMYALKATGADARLTAGNELTDVQHSFGHSSKAMTRIYDKHDREKQLVNERLRKIIPAY